MLVVLAFCAVFGALAGAVAIAALLLLARRVEDVEFALDLRRAYETADLPFHSLRQQAADRQAAGEGL